ncbi:hypothetical protein UACE39S_00964 [Ureibacillus acetophenoni]
MKNRSQAYYRHQRARAINRKLKIIKNAWAMDQEALYIKNPGRLSKAKLNCSCVMCKYEKHFAILKAKVKSKMDIMQWDIDEYFNK